MLIICNRNLGSLSELSSLPGFGQTFHHSCEDCDNQDWEQDCDDILGILQYITYLRDHSCKSTVFFVCSVH